MGSGKNKHGYIFKQKTTHKNLGEKERKSWSRIAE
jgi:hypothetical protein